MVSFVVSIQRIEEFEEALREPPDKGLTTELHHIIWTSFFQSLAEVDAPSHVYFILRRSTGSWHRGWGSANRRRAISNPTWQPHLYDKVYSQCIAFLVPSLAFILFSIANQHLIEAHDLLNYSR